MERGVKAGGKRMKATRKEDGSEEKVRRNWVEREEKEGGKAGRKRVE